MAYANQAPANAGGPTSHTPMLDDLDFEDAVRAAEKARIALTGPSGSGKTYTALSLATGMIPEGGTIGVIDTERGSASKYAGLFTFKTMKLPSYEPQALIRALAIAASRGIDVVIIDSLTHFWSGRGGALAQVDAKTEASRSKNAFTSGWKDVTPLLLDMLDAILSYPGHVIGTMRVKTEWVIQENDRGKKEPTKVGTKLDQRDGMDYEFDLVGAMDQAHVLTVDKSRYPTIEVGSTHASPDFSFGRAIADWLDDGDGSAPGVLDYAAAAIEAGNSHQDLLRLFTEVENRGLLGAAVLDMNRTAVSLGKLIKMMGTAALVREGKQTVQELRSLYANLEQAGRIKDLVPGMDGQPIAIGELIKYTAEDKTAQASAGTGQPEATPSPQQNERAGEGADASSTGPATDHLARLQAQANSCWNGPENALALSEIILDAEKHGVADSEVKLKDGRVVTFRELLNGRISELQRQAEQGAEPHAA
ncbi:ATP-binding protein [Streptomyces olivaceiscleroticus]|uniref:AAA+ ATPase domain-containing protein n=1 Tax=Streptomyces olivaceiscleroticus TaxID=68245 RepID=A0ABN1BLN8_9ACTN